MRNICSSQGLLVNLIGLAMQVLLGHVESNREYVSQYVLNTRIPISKWAISTIRWHFLFNGGDFDVAESPRVWGFWFFFIRGTVGIFADTLGI